MNLKIECFVLRGGLMQVYIQPLRAVNVLIILYRWA